MSEDLDRVVGAAKASKIAKKLGGRQLCDHCLGRLFGRISRSLSNDRRGEAIRKSLRMEKASTCWLCDGLMDDIGKFSRIVEEEMTRIEFETFLIGSRVDPEIENKEESLWIELGLHEYERLKSEINREVGKLVQRNTGREVDFKAPDVVAVIDTMFDDVELIITPLFVYGRYKKFVRDLPQTTWTCRACWGAGCEKCKNTGKEYPTSIKDLIGGPFMEASESEDYSFHGAGREDVDVRMLGRGRPFVLELIRPKRRNLNLSEVGRAINRCGMIEVSQLRMSNRAEVRNLKAARYPKSYKAIIELGKPISEQKLKEVVHSFKGRNIAQKTPTRVSKRRVDKVRERKVLEISASLQDDSTAELFVKAEAGTYIKELIDGDEGRTKPNLAEMLGADCKVKYLDVIEIHDEVEENG